MDYRDSSAIRREAERVRCVFIVALRVAVSLHLPSLLAACARPALAEERSHDTTAGGRQARERSRGGGERQRHRRRKRAGGRQDKSREGGGPARRGLTQRDGLSPPRRSLGRSRISVGLAPLACPLHPPLSPPPSSLCKWPHAEDTSRALPEQQAQSRMESRQPQPRTLRPLRRIPPPLRPVCPSGSHSITRCCAARFWWPLPYGSCSFACPMRRM